MEGFLELGVPFFGPPTKDYTRLGSIGPRIVGRKLVFLDPKTEVVR